jgi:hypothetical protein
VEEEALRAAGHDVAGAGRQAEAGAFEERDSPVVDPNQGRRAAEGASRCHEA